MPFCYALKDNGIFTDYEHSRFRTAFRAFIEKLPGKEQNFYDALRVFTLEIYQYFADVESIYFLDKTPRYHLIAQHIMRAFPDGKFIFLWRNPLSIASSLIQSWGEGRWNLYRYKVDLYRGIENLVRAYSERSNRVEAYTLRFEDLVSRPRNEVKELFAFLGVPFEESALEAFAGIDFKGEMGDQKGVQQYQSISQAPVDKWKSVLNNPLRKAWARQYLQWIGENRFGIMGYDMEEFLDDLKGSPLSFDHLIHDIYSLVKGAFRPVLEKRIWYSKINTLKKEDKIVAHS